jgi:5-methylthioadenosine/S-adenosylhomocysteine deaminase
MNRLIRGGAIVTCDGNHRVLAGDVAIVGSSIVAIGPDAASRLPPPFEIVDATGCIVMPGLVQTHVHLVQALFRGMAEDVPLLTWLEQRIWPFEAAHDEASLKTSAELGLVEMLRAGTTAIMDMGTTHGHDVVLDACERSGIRAVSGKALMDRGDTVPKKLRENTKASLREAERLAKHWAGRGNGRIQYGFCPRFILTCSEELIRGAVGLADDLGQFLHTHASEHADERKAVEALLGGSDIMLLDGWGFRGDRAVLAHCVQITADEMAHLAIAKTNIAHCPSANLKLGSGIAPVAALRKAGVNVGLGGDGAPCNNNLDPWLEMRHAALLAKIKSGIASLSARDVVRMATIDGAKVLGIDRVAGSLEVGKRADVVVVDIMGAHVAPAADLMATLVYGTRATDVRHVFIDGERVVENGVVQTLDGERIAATARSEAIRIGKAAGVL